MPMIVSLFSPSVAPAVTSRLDRQPPAVASPRAVTLVALTCLALALGGCSFKRATPPAPVEDRTTSSMSSVTREEPVEAAKPLPPGAENEGKPGYYTVRPGDSLMRISLSAGQNWRDVVRWNNLENPNRIEVGQVLRIVPPVAVAPPAPPVPVVAATSKPAAPASSAAPAVVAGGVTTSAVSESAVAAKPLPSSAAKPAAAALPAAAAAGEDQVSFIWPASGALVASFDDQKNKGVGIGGKAGDPVLAAADGRVVYAGSGLRGYGNLIILKHNNTYLTAYAHNQLLLVKEDQDVRQGQKIAEMGSSDADRVKLHFEVRRQGKPVDPTRYLPSR